MKPDPRVGEMDCPAPLTMVQAAKCLEQIYEDKFFALVDTWDPHEPWDPPSYYTRHYLPDYAGERVHPPYGDCKKHGMTDRDIAVARALYSGELELVDRWIGHLLDQVAYLGIEDSTAIIFASDHGFLLGGHGMMGKMVRRAPGEATWMRSPLYEEIARVPLLIHVPGAKPGRTGKLACALDIAPTICDMAGLPRQPEMQGHSLLPGVLGQKFEGRDHVLTALPLGRNSLFRAVKGKTIPEWAKDFDAATWGQFFLKFLLGNPHVTAVIPGTGNPEHMIDNLGAGRGRMPDAQQREKMAAVLHA